MPQSPANKGSLAVVFLTVFIDLLGFGIVLPLLPIYARQFVPDETGVTLGLLAASFSAMQFLFAPVWGRLSDRVGRRPVLMIGLAGSVVFYTLFGLATTWQSVFWMFVSRIGAGIAGATIPTAQAYIADTTTRENRMKGMAIIGAAFGLGFTFGPLIGAAALWAAGGGLSPWPGYVAAALSAAALLLAVFKLPEPLRPDSAAAHRTLLDLAAFRRALAMPTVGALILTSFVSILSFGTFEATLSFVLKVEPDEGGFGFGYVDVFLMFALLGLSHAVAQGFVRRLASRLPEARMASAGATVSIVGFLLLTAATATGSLSLFVAAMIIESTGFAFMPASLQSLISRRSDPAEQGAVLGVAQGTGAVARILAHGIGIPLFRALPELPFLVGAALMIVALILVSRSARGGRDFAPGANAADRSTNPASEPEPSTT